VGGPWSRRRHPTERDDHDRAARRWPELPGHVRSRLRGSRDRPCRCCRSCVGRHRRWRRAATRSSRNVWGKEAQSQGGGWLGSARVGLRRRAGRHIKDRAGGRVERDRPTRWRGSTPWVCSRLKPPWEARREREVQEVGEPTSGMHAPELPLRARAVPWVQERRQGSGRRLRPFPGPRFLARGDPAEAVPGLGPSSSKEVSGKRRP
jgi:hypothetical protein